MLGAALAPWWGCPRTTEWTTRLEVVVMAVVTFCWAWRGSLSSSGGSTGGGVSKKGDGRLLWTCSLHRRRVYWPKIAAAVHRHKSKCKRCVIAKISQPIPRVIIRHLLPFRPSDVLAIDFANVDRGRGSCDDVLVMTDVYTKYEQAVLCKDHVADTVAKALN